MHESRRRRRIFIGDQGAVGCTRGCSLGPLLFLVHINDLPDCVTSSVRLFADDCLLYRLIRSLKDQEELQKDLRSLEMWADKWGMKFNAKKCYILTITDKGMHKFYNLKSHILKNVENNPYLGLNVWEPAVEINGVYPVYVCRQEWRALSAHVDDP